MKTKKTTRKGTLKVKISKQSNATLIHFLALELIRKRPYDAYLSKRALNDVYDVVSRNHSDRWLISAFFHVCLISDDFLSIL